MGRDRGEVRDRHLMLGKNWRFTKFIPDVDDVDAEINAYNGFRAGRAKEVDNVPQSFSAGFYRGCKWMQDKIKNRGLK